MVHSACKASSQIKQIPATSGCRAKLNYGGPGSGNAWRKKINRKGGGGKGVGSGGGEDKENSGTLYNYCRNNKTTNIRLFFTIFLESSIKNELYNYIKLVCHFH